MESTVVAIPNHWQHILRFVCDTDTMKSTCTNIDGWTENCHTCFRISYIVTAIFLTKDEKWR